jgi:hypothetical protein
MKWLTQHKLGLRDTECVRSSCYIYPQVNNMPCLQLHGVFMLLCADYLLTGFSERESHLMSTPYAGH